MAKRGRFSKPLVCAASARMMRDLFWGVGVLEDLWKGEGRGEGQLWKLFGLAPGFGCRFLGIGCRRIWIGWLRRRGGGMRLPTLLGSRVC